MQQFWYALGSRNRAVGMAMRWLIGRQNKGRKLRINTYLTKRFTSAYCNTQKYGNLITVWLTQYRKVISIPYG
jgi:hypothetical protein